MCANASHAHAEVRIQGHNSSTVKPDTSSTPILCVFEQRMRWRVREYAHDSSESLLLANAISMRVRN